MINMAEDETKKICFVIGPIGKEGTEKRDKADILLEYIIKPAFSDDSLNYKVYRADEVDDPGTITDRVILDTINSDLVIADLTGHNANAFYELGIRHAEGKPTIHMIAEDEEPPFDVIDQRIIKYNLSNPKFHQKAKEDLEQKIKATLEKDYQVQNPVTRARGYESLKNTGDPKDALIAHLMDRVTKLENEQKQINNDLIRNDIRTDILSNSLGFPSDSASDDSKDTNVKFGMKRIGATPFPGKGLLSMYDRVVPENPIPPHKKK
ncbi:MAG: hypothetical protein DBP02_16685 [gamma proteobacterium symbiont of Ctena orbiculata]|nr:MAG: hypothetical protein DBP02_16685 [gamma proteobacterium symbiont of Ctena orbiculata]